MKKILLPILIILLGILFYKPIENNDKLPTVNYYEVNITGEVLKPGVYRVPEKTSYNNAIKMAGPTKKSVYLDNHDYIVKNTNINVLKREKSIDLNTASKEELMSIPNIGEKKAIAIIKYRTINKFKSYIEVKEVLNIKNNDALLKIMSYTVIR